MKITINCKKLEQSQLLTKALLIASLVTLILLVFTGCSKEVAITDETLSFSGDVDLWSSIQEVAPNMESQQIQYNDKALEAYALDECINAFKPVVNTYDVYIQAKDGFMVKLDGHTINDTFLAYIKGQGWTYISDKHPVNSCVKNISDIIIVSNIETENSDKKLIEGIDPDEYGLNIIAQDKNHYFTKGELLIRSNRQYIMEDGVSTFDGISIDVLKQKQGVSLKTLYNKDFSKLLVYTFAGEEFYDYSNGVIEVTSDQINYVTEDLSQQKLNIVGIMIDPIGTSVTNNYYDVQYFMDKDIRVISILLDGFSYEQLDYIRLHNKDLLLSKETMIKKAKTVYKPVTNAGFAAIVSGVEPIKSGVLNRSYRELKVPTVFDYCQETNKSHILIEGDINILNLNTRTLLNLDDDKNGFTDNEIMDNVREIMTENYDYNFIHFHSIDEFGHNFGPLADDTINQIAYIDKFVGEIIEDFDGKIIITADHGMHTVADHGDHGDFRVEDMFVPYMIIDGGLYEE